MRAYIALLFLLAMLSTVVQPSMAVNFSIIVYDSNGKLLENAFIRIVERNNLVTTGYTDGSGLFETYLNDGWTYDIEAKYDDRRDEKKNYMVDAKSPRIELKLHA